jgi:hypothetical protein
MGPQRWSVMANMLRFSREVVAGAVPLFVLGLAAVGCSTSNASSPSTPDAQIPDSSSTEGGMQGDADTGPLPTVTGPITGGCSGKPFTAAPLDLASYGYIEQEYFFEGNASAYDWASPPGADGLWSVKATTTAHYKSRMLVRRPADSAKFNGTVMVEWLNVTGGLDVDPDFGYARVELLRSGFGYVGVSAQAVGVVGGPPSITGSPPIPLVQADPQRYGTLLHPGDDYSYDIFTQAARALRHPGGVDPLGGLPHARLIGDGESQSAVRLVTYVDAIHPIAGVFDGFFIHSRFGGGALLNGSADAGSAGILSGPSPAHIRSDLKVPVFQFETETDVAGLGPGQGFSVSRQPDTDLVRTWEVAGTAHADQYLSDYEQSAFGDAGVIACGIGDSGATVVSCGMPNAGPQHWVEDAAISAMHAWAKDGKLPPMGAPITFAASGSALARDANGIVLGGVRTPEVDVPIATYSGQPATGSSIVCSLFGQTLPFTTAQLRMLYPTHDDYVSKVTAAATQDQQAGFLLAADVPVIEREAQSAPVPQ